MILSEHLNQHGWKPYCPGPGWGVTIARNDPMSTHQHLVSDDPVLKNVGVSQEPSDVGPVTVVRRGGEIAWYNQDNGLWYYGGPPASEPCTSGPAADGPVTVRVHAWRTLQVATALLCLCVKFEVAEYGNSYADFRFPAGIDPTYLEAVKCINSGKRAINNWKAAAEATLQEALKEWLAQEEEEEEEGDEVSDSEDDSEDDDE